MFDGFYSVRFYGFSCFTESISIFDDIGSVTGIFAKIGVSYGNWAILISSFGSQFALVGVVSI